MANTITLRRSAVANHVPTTGQLALGELALNTYDGKLFTKVEQNGSASIVELSGGEGGGGGGGTPVGSGSGVMLETQQTINADFS
ncbi:MAG: hypothetical protein GY918_07220, partial [Gammaproteobacteria bacterium]|nr:hypothetical protein [Gammaproteobacteria bacterium]